LISFRWVLRQEQISVNFLNNFPRFHKFAFWYAWNGFRCSQHIWRIARRVDSSANNVMVALPNGFPMIVNDLDWISKSVYEGTYERSLLHFLGSLDLTGEIVDVGANIGVTLWHSLKNSPAETHYLAFEPSKQCSTGLELTLSHIKQEGKVHNLAIGASNETGEIFGVNNEFHSGGASLIHHSGLRGNSQKVQVRTLDSILTESKITLDISLLKIDTEGFEANVIKGASALLKSHRVEIIVMEVSPNFGSVEYLNVVDELLGGGYKWFLLDESGLLRRQPLLRNVTLKESLGFSEQWNLVMVRNDIEQEYKAWGHKYFNSIPV
jgi:FkbM family methyltransferase